MVAIIGPVGSGKTSLLMCLMEELKVLTGQMSLNGSLFYVPQEPWIFTASIRQNILFGKPFDQEKYDKIIEVCCLEHVIHISLKLYH